MFGSDALVAPIVYEDTYEREVYLLQGAFETDVHSAKRCMKGQPFP